MTERASDLLSELAVRLSADPRDSGQVVAESVVTLEPELLKAQQDGSSIDELVRTSVSFLEILFRSLRADSRVPWQQYYTLARQTSRRYAEKGIPLESVMEGLAVFRRSVLARVTEEMIGNEHAEEVLLLARSRLGDVVEQLNSSFIWGYLDFTEARHHARQTELHALYHIASALGRSLDVAEIAEVGLREAHAGEDPRPSAWRGGGVRIRPIRRAGACGRDCFRSRGVARRPHHRRMERHPRRAADEGRPPRSHDCRDPPAANLRAQRPGVRRRGRRPDRGRSGPRSAAHERGAHRLPHRARQPAGVRASDRPRCRIRAAPQAPYRLHDDRPRQPERDQ